MTTRSFDDTDLLAYSAEHIAYEVGMFFGMADMLSSSKKIGSSSSADAIRLNFAMIEAFVIHLRNLIDFLYSDRPKPTDIIAADFCATWQTERPIISPVLKNARVRANKELAHLTTNRLAGSPPAKQWEFSVLAGEISSLLHLFVKHARVNALSPDVAQEIR